MASLLSIASVLPLYSPSVNTRFTVSSKATAAGSCDAIALKPCARPTSGEDGLGPVVNGSSTA
ncbi:hypothetical protein MUK42_11870 [Musa troglodytarum]|uniref:Uncharacterized protein n=1 Tax=Musa troglodytarum TaxID=320322 RepID=A0A9E7I8W0_9LILI|nr:hypothetical protein MUK42_11870 [Musa troglodytarum]